MRVNGLVDGFLGKDECEEHRNAVQGSTVERTSGEVHGTNHKNY